MSETPPETRDEALGNTRPVADVPPAPQGVPVDSTAATTASAKKQRSSQPRLSAARARKGKLFEWGCVAATWVGVAFLVILLAGLFVQARGWLDWQFISSFDSRFPNKAGFLAAIWGSFWLILLTIIFTVPLGVGAALYLEEYASDRWLTRVIRINLANLAGVPSIVYGILGLTLFVRMFGMFGTGKTLVLGVPPASVAIPLPFGRTVISGSLTLTLLILPVVIVASQEALRAIPPSLRHAALALGATRWQTVRHQVLPAALPGILTGIILAVSRAIGETAPLIMIGALTYLAFAPGDITHVRQFATEPGSIADAPFDMFTAMPIQIFNWVVRPNPDYQHVAAAGILVLLFVLLTLNALAIFIRARFQKHIRW